MVQAAHWLHTAHFLTKDLVTKDLVAKDLEKQGRNREGETHRPGEKRSRENTVSGRAVHPVSAALCLPYCVGHPFFVPTESCVLSSSRTCVRRCREENAFQVKWFSHSALSVCLQLQGDFQHTSRTCRLNERGRQEEYRAMNSVTHRSHTRDKKATGCHAQRTHRTTARQRLYSLVQRAIAYFAARDQRLCRENCSPFAQSPGSRAGKVQLSCAASSCRKCGTGMVLQA